MSAVSGTGTRLKLALALVAAVILGGSTTHPAVAADVAVPRNFTPSPQLAQEYDLGDPYYTYRPACPDHYYYACRYGPIGIPHCACWPGLGFYLLRYN